MRKSVTIQVDKNFFENIFEPERKKLQNQLGMHKFTQSNFTSYLERAGLKLKYKMKKPKVVSKRFLPNRFNGGIDFSL